MSADALVDHSPATSAEGRTEGASISAVLPAHNEAENIVAAVESLVAILSDLTPVWEIVVVDDGSDDDTAGLVRGLSRRWKQVRLAQHPVNRGYGAALKTGLEQARHAHLFVMDADLQFDPGELKTLLPLAGDYDIVLGYRKRRREHFGRRFNARCWGLLMQLLFGLRVQDINCAFKIFNSRVFDHITIRSQGAMVCSEVLIQAKKSGYTIKEVPVTHYPRKRGRSSGAKPKTIYRAFSDLVRLYGDLKEERPDTRER
jgi:glycosyltransferase involved in cell wall biosynthesis